MTTTAERIEQIKARAATAGFNTNQRRPAISFERREPRETMPAEPVAPLDLACRRPMPNAWEKIPDEFRQRNRREIIDKLEMRIMSRLIARCLGDEWTAEERGEYIGFYLRHKPTGAAIHMRHDWNKTARLRFSPDEAYDRTLSAITVDRKRTPAAIAADIERRLIGEGLIEQYRKAKQSQYERRQEHARRIHQMQRAAKSFGLRIDKPYKWSSQGYPEAGRRGIVNLSCTYNDKLCICIETADTELAAAIGELYHNWSAP